MTLICILARGWGLLATYGLKTQHYKIAKNMRNSEGKKKITEESSLWLKIYTSIIFPLENIWVPTQPAG